MTDFARLVLDADTRGLKSGERDLDSFAKTSEKAAGTVTSGMVKVGAAIGSVVALAGGIGSVIRTNAEFGRSMSQVAAVSGASAAELEDLRATALRMGADTAFSAAQAADALGFLAQAGFSAAEAIDAIPDVLSLAAAGGLELAQAADIAANVLSGFRLEIEDASRVADVLAKSAAVSNSSVQGMGEAMSVAAPIAAALGISIEETAAAVGLMSDAGIKGSEAGTALRGVFASLAGPTNQAQEVLAKYGLTASEIDPQTVGLANAMATLSEKGLSTADAFIVFGREAASGALVLAENAARMKDLTGEYQNAGGAAAEMASVMRDNLTGDIDGLTGSVETLIIKLGDAGVTGLLRTLAQTGTAGLNLLAENMRALVGVVTVAGSAFAAYRLAVLAGVGVTAAFSGSLGIFAGAVVTTTRQVGLLAGAQVALTGVTAGARVGLAALLGAINPIALAVAGVTAAVAYYYTQSVKSDQQNQAAIATLDEMDQTLRDAGLTMNAMGEYASNSAGQVNKLGGAFANAAAQARQFAIDARQSKLVELAIAQGQIDRQIRERTGKGHTRTAGLHAFRAFGRMVGLIGPDTELQDLLERRDLAEAQRKALLALPMPTGEVAKAAEVATASVAGIGNALASNAAKSDVAAKDIMSDFDAILSRALPLQAELAGVTKAMDDLNKMRSELDPSQYVQVFDALERQAGALRSEIEFGAILPAEIIPQYKDWEAALGGFADKAKTSSVQIAESFRDMANRTMDAFSRLTSAIRGGGFLGILEAVIGLGFQLGSIGAFGKSVQDSINRPRIPSADGGGWTGHGSRTGGMDGRGGFLALLHPDETVLDHTRGQGLGRQAPANVNVTVGVDPRNGNILAFVNGQIAATAPAVANAGASQAMAQSARAARRRVR